MNHNLHKAKHNKRDEFYTQMVDIERELQHYKEHFVDKIVYCNCDTEDSNFVKYFRDNYNSLNLAGLNISSNDFRDNVDLLKQSDIVVTNPPFSLFREYIAQLIEYDKKFLIIGHQNAISYKEIFPLIRDNKLWLGYGFKGGAGHFINKHYDDYASAADHKEGMIRVSGVHWFTNLKIDKRHEELILVKKYNKSDYPKYENYNAIEVGKTKDIPNNYKGVMGVPITFLDKYNPDQFEIIDINPHFFSIVEKGQTKPKQLKIAGRKDPYARILIRHKGIK